jgi:hypothetical protein
MNAIGIHDKSETRSLIWSILIGAVLMMLTIAVYLPALNSLMVADDFIKIDQMSFDSAVRSLHVTSGFGRNEYRPVVAFSYALSAWVWHGTVRGYHFDNVYWHSINTVLFFLWLMLLTRSAAISGMAAVIFAVHPTSVERVAWITARDCIVSTIFMLLALIAYTLARRNSERKPGIFECISVISFFLSLLSYEGSVVFPGLLIALEFIIFEQRDQGWWMRLRTAFIKTRWHILALFIYLAWWIYLFRGETGQYNESFALGSMLHNYYSLLYQLFHGNAHLAGALYFGLLFTVFLMQRDRRLLAAFSLLFLLVAFIPFILSTGFAPRFAYASSIGYATLVALMIHACAALKNARAGVVLAGLVFAVFAGYYAIAVRTRLSDWEAAGRIADAIPRQVKTMHPNLPSGATLMLSHIPQMYGHAYVYPLGLEAAIKHYYPDSDLRFVYGPGEMNSIVPNAKPQASPVFYFNYDAAGGRLEEITLPR